MKNNKNWFMSKKFKLIIYQKKKKKKKNPF
jgi:hypothetical protein